MKGIKLSVVVITFNEERNIERCLESVTGIADEIVVVDSGSTDQTTEIAKRMGAVIFHQPFLGHIEQKNLALSKASNDWCLSLDADEALSEELRSSILCVKSSPSKSGYQMNRMTNYCGKWIRHCGWYPDRKIRLFNRSFGAWTGTNPHDRFELKKNASLGFLKGNILHYSFYSINQHIDQIKYFTDISSRQLFENGKKPSVLKIILSPIVKFIRDYFWKLGFLDGFYGLVISVNSAHAKFLKYSKLYQLHKNKT